jgi:hypothetical protein
MTEAPPKPLTTARDQPDTAMRQEIMRLWQTTVDGNAGPRGDQPPQPDDPIAHALLEAAELAIGQGKQQPAARILKLVVSDYRDSQEAAFARRVLDQLAKDRPR